MSLQRRLTLFFILIVILPLAVAGFVVQRVVVGEIGRRALLSVRPALDATTVLYNDRVEAIDERVRASLGSARFVRLLERGRPEPLDRNLERHLMRSSGLDFIIALDRAGDVLAWARERPRFVEGYEAPTLENILAAGAGSRAGFVRTPQIPVVRAGEGRVGAVVGGFWLDEEALIGASQQGVQLALVVDDRIVASTAAGTTSERLSPREVGVFEVNIAGEGKAEARKLSDQVTLVAWTPTGPIEDRARLVRTAMLGLLALALAATAALAYFLARLVTQDLEELSQGAVAIAEGRFDHRIPVRSRDEVGRLAAVFNDMAERLRVTITELQRSRDQLERAVTRVGETLRSTHDMNQILDSIVQTASDAVDADAATLWRFLPTRVELQPVLGIDLEIDELSRLKVGEGIVGLVAERGITVSQPDPRGGPHTAPAEPDFPVVVAVPLYSQNRITGVMAMYRRDPARPFSRKDIDTVTFLAEQGGVAVENVALHEEANRLSLTDGLTGIYNRRYFQMQFRQVMATAVRFERPFSVLMLDLDNFKEVNDTHGHQRGDSVLVEFAHRVTRELREVDTFARWGGEEFMCLLPETNVAGAVTTAQKVLEVIRSEPFGGEGEHPLPITVSIGIAAHPEHGSSYRELVESADQALYRAKQEGRDRLCVSGESSSPPLKLAE